MSPASGGKQGRGYCGEARRPNTAVVNDHFARGDAFEPVDFDSPRALEHHFTGLCQWFTTAQLRVTKCLDLQSFHDIL